MHGIKLSWGTYLKYGYEREQKYSEKIEDFPPIAAEQRLVVDLNIGRVHVTVKIAQ